MPRTIKNTDPLFKSFMDVYYKWFEKQVGIKPRIEVSDATALKQVIKYFRSIMNDADVQENNKTDLEILFAWEFVFANYGKWDKFHQKQLKLRQINSNLMNILNSIKNGKQQTPIAKSIGEQYNDIINDPSWGDIKNIDVSKSLPTK